MDLNNIGEDRISELPDSLIHRILHLLKIKDVACTFVLSKRWSHIWTTVPTLNFPDCLTLCGFQFIDDCWNERHISSCPVLVNLILVCCSWYGVRNFCISTPALEHLVISHDDVVDDDGLQDCSLKINAPNLVSFTYRGCVAKEYVLSSFQTLKSARVDFCNEYDVPKEQKIGAAVSKFFQALAYVQTLTIYAETLEAVSVTDDFVNILPTFHNLEELFQVLFGITDKSVFPLLRAAPNLTRLVFTYYHIANDVEEDSWDGLRLTAGCLFQHLRYVSFMRFTGNAREMRWLKLILKNAKDFQTVTIGAYVNSVDTKIK